MMSVVERKTKSILLEMTDIDVAHQHRQQEEADGLRIVGGTIRGRNSGWWIRRSGRVGRLDFKMLQLRG